MPSYPQTRRRDLLRLVELLLRSRRRGDAGGAIAAWLGELMARYGSRDLMLNLLLRRVLFVSGPELSAHVLAAPPSTERFVAGTMKQKAMSFLAPHALTILDGGSWQAMREYNEAVLQPGRPHAHLSFLLPQVERRFAIPLRGTEDLRRRMGEVMLAALFGEGNAPAHLIDEVQELFAEVRPRTALFGSRKQALRDRFKGELRQLWQSGAGRDEPTLIALAHRAAAQIEAGDRREEMLIDQIPHWMFTFTNSGSDLLARALAVLAARPQARLRANREVEAAGSLVEPAALARLMFLEACIRETGRLFPPVVLTAHRAAVKTVCNGRDIPAGTEIVHFFPLNNRDTSADSLAGSFHPDRWLGPDAADRIRASNLFLSGARVCPGRDLILAVIKAAIAHQLRLGLQPRRNRLSDDPLPFTFPTECLSFRSMP
jgi:cytochrome P450